MKNNLLAALKVWAIAQLIYLVINLASIPLIHSYPELILIYSEMLAICCGLPALLIFAVYYHLLAKYMNNKGARLVLTITGGLSLTFLATLLAAAWMSNNGIWSMWLRNIEYPICGILCAAISLFINRKHIYTGAR